ncbi:PACE efflux transporter [Desulfovibrio ferrophilus]|uniref:Transmembrane pair domain protein n=1 Tax=Desulfovibrio ferrophilus TaxID=241368 RepID=A0A2Z6B070_9BACT|nr:PACE efflux transporter [Desulfovibrio ferrophilus]BBD08845.1 transmembrane pair domain protein [Desulfovibrio ferrophilus]
MRTKTDRFRHTILYELLLITLAVPILSWALDLSPGKLGAYSVAMSTLAMIWNYAYNLSFDHLLLHQGKPLYPRGFFLRLLHSLGFEGSFLLVCVPAGMWWLGYDLLTALTVNLSFILVVPIYTMGFNWLYDMTFPVAEPVTH